MIKREHLRQAIKAIAERDPEIGYSLNEMLESAQIDVLRVTDDPKKRHLYFLYLGQRIPVRKFQFFNEGSVILEERLLIKYGESHKRQEILASREALDYRTAALDIHRAGLELLVKYEIDLARERLQRRSVRAGRTTQKKKRGSLQDSESGDTPFLFDLLEGLKHSKKITQSFHDAPVMFQGVVDHDTPAYFINLPFSMDTLCQIADINLDFFHIRFILTCLLNGLGPQLFAAVVNNRVAGMLYLRTRDYLFHAELEIKHIATVREEGRQFGEISFPVPAGIGSLLTSGAWMLWKTRRPEARRITLESELGARRFYESMGFRRKAGYEYYLQEPRGYLLRNIVRMALSASPGSDKAVPEIASLLARQGKYLTARRNKKRAVPRQAVLDTLQECLRNHTCPAFTEAAVELLRGLIGFVPEAQQLLVENGYYKENLLPDSWVTSQPVSIIFDERYMRHIENLCHLENPKRIAAIQAVLDDPALKGAWRKLPPVSAGIEELKWVHTDEYIRQLAGTSGRPLTSFDLDTQTSERSFEVACLAAGGVFTLLDHILNGESRRGFAFVRPPGHHAAPNKAMGYCLLNNVALGAKYLKNRFQVEKILIVDIDAHHGNGTQDVFYETDEVLFISLHQFPSFPGTGNLGEVGRNAGEGFTVNVPLSRGQDDRTLAQAIYWLVGPLARQYKPEIMLVSCGFDFYVRDPTSQMNVTPQGYALMTALLLEIAEEVCEGRVCFVMEGGYSMQGIKSCGLAVMKELCGISDLAMKKIDKIKNSEASRSSVIKKVMQVQEKYWNFYVPPTVA
jgi:acetoin utilization deacetylase AcuC-like enzyme